ncbi:hypothetical protein AGMMS49938_18120 [Fibrobacterales bacterium]|nr:hypothetical protein AGMMS49938_18120 [Fibrobacterales bacterium]
MRKISLFLYLIFVCSAFAIPTYYGASGYTFVPDGFVGSHSQYSGFIGGELVSLKNVRLYPKYLAFNTALFDNRFELALSSAYSFTGSDGYKPKKIASGLAPIIPSVKVKIADRNGELVRIGYSVGAMVPYGVYLSTSTKLNTPVLQPELTLAVSLWTERGYGMVGTRLQTADLSGHPLPLAFTAEGGWASSMSLMGETEESFITFGTELALGRNLTLIGNFRRDPTTYYNFDGDGNKEDKKNGQNTEGKWSLRLEFHL